MDSRFVVRMLRSLSVPAGPIFQFGVVNMKLLLCFYLVSSGASAADPPKQGWIIRRPSTVSLQRLSRRIPPSAIHAFEKATEAVRRNDMSAFESQLGNAIETAPLFTEALNNLGAYYARKGDLGRAQVLLQRAADSDSGNAIAVSNLGVLALTRGDLSEAETRLRRALELEPALVESRYALGMVLAALGRSPEEAVQSLQIAAGKYPSAHIRAALILRRLGRSEDAAEEIRAYVRTGDSQFVAVAEALLASPATGRTTR